jgi:hypothetical protein
MSLSIVDCRSFAGAFTETLLRLLKRHRFHQTDLHQMVHEGTDGLATREGTLGTRTPPYFLKGLSGINPDDLHQDNYMKNRQQPEDAARHKNTLTRLRRVQSSPWYPVDVPSRSGMQLWNTNKDGLLALETIVGFMRDVRDGAQRGDG